MKKLVLIQPVSSAGYSLLEDRPDVDWQVLDDVPSTDELALAIADADGITIRISELSPVALQSARRLKVISRHGVGYDNIPVDYCTKRRIAVAVTGDANSQSVAEHAMYMMLSAARAGSSLDSSLRLGNYDVRVGYSGIELFGKTLLVVGFGRIGRKVAALADAFGMRILVHDPFLDSDDLGPYVHIRKLEDGLAQADVLSLHLPLTPETNGMIGPSELDMLPAGSVVVNVSRGGLIDEASLLDRVKSRHVYGAGLDTFVDEPLPPDSPLLAETRIVLSPHSASLTDSSIRNMGVQTIRNALDGMDGKLDPRLVVNPEVLQ